MNARFGNHVRLEEHMIHLPIAGDELLFAFWQMETPIDKIRVHGV